MKSYSEIDDSIALSVDQNLSSKHRVSRVALSVGIFFFAAICGYALLSAIGPSCYFLFASVLFGTDKLI
jgi:hypothetical protein